MLSVVVSTMMMADDVTPEEALQQATQFVHKRMARGNGPRLAPGVQPKLTLASRVSDLYVFNVGSDAGFIIVSNDDCAVPILGYSDNGSFDANNIPDNMRAWLQGYADEIAWAKANNVKPVANAPASAPQLTGTAVKTAIAPLLTTTWNQNAPYNNLTPYYGISSNKYVYSTTYIENYKHCATGCVATAMAQVMKYHEWPTEATIATTAYRWGRANVQLPALASTTFDWANMQDSYTGKETDETATAVATLMQYCGYSVQMDYGPESSSGTVEVANALKSYFDYNSTTTQYVTRSYYSYANWIELIYHELKNGRPVVYGGQSTGGGHEFVCDGYQGEDFFHINWGWGGLSDNYFKLSALDSDEQGIGGSSSTDGYHYGQDAVIGIQPSTSHGTIADVTANEVDVQVTSMSLSNTSIELGQSVDITMNVKNNSDDDFDGTLYVGIKYYEEDVYKYDLLQGEHFNIPANQTKDCVVSYTPTSTGTYSLVFFFPNTIGSYYTDGVVHATLTVTEGSSHPTATNLELGRSLVVENSEIINGEEYNVYGSTFKGVLTVTNTSNEYDYDGYYQYNLWQNDGNSWNELGYKSTHVLIPAGGSVNIPIEYEGMAYNSMFEVDVTYYLGTGWASWDEVGYYYPQPAFITYTADGTQTVVKATENYTVPEGVLSLDLSGTGVTSVTKNSEPNCLFIIDASDTAPSGVDNVVKKNGTSYTATNITLTDGSPFYSPVDFTAANIAFTYNNTKQADGTNGWNSLMLPFNVTSVTANDEPIDWFHSSTDTGKKFWVKEFVSDESNQVYFDYADAIEANTPYIIALPGNKWGANWDLSDKTIKFIGENVDISKGGTLSSITGANFRFVGNTVQDNTANIYCLNADGNAFVLKETGGSAPFRAYFKPGTFDASVTNLGIASWSGGTTSISEPSINISNETPATWYSIDGRRLTTKPTQKGIYIQNGKKVVIK